MSAALYAEPPQGPARPAWLVSGVRAIDVARGVVGTVLTVGCPYSYVTLPTSVFLVPAGGGEPWEAQIGDLCQAEPGAER